jgi:hypothetical protein
MCDELSPIFVFTSLPRCRHTQLRSGWTIGYNSLLDCQFVDSRLTMGLFLSFLFLFYFEFRLIPNLHVMQRLDKWLI